MFVDCLHVAVRRAVVTCSVAPLPPPAHSCLFSQLYAHIQVPSPLNFANFILKFFHKLKLAQDPFPFTLLREQMAHHGPINGVKISRMLFPLSIRVDGCLFSLLNEALDDPHKVVKVIAQDGKTGDQTDVSYTNCKVIGNGSFGIVFQARLVGGPHEGEDIAIKKVLQDKRFKVCTSLLVLFARSYSSQRTENFKSCVLCHIPMLSTSKRSFIQTETRYVPFDILSMMFVSLFTSSNRRTRCI